MRNDTNLKNNMEDLEEKKHVYDYEVLVDADTAPARVVRMVGNNKTVLEVGSGPGSITKILTAKNKCRVTALEVDPTAISIVEKFCESVVPADLNNPLWPDNFNGKKFDCVIAADVLEHVYKPLDVLTGMKSLLNENGEIVISLPHIGHAGISASLLSSDFTYKDWGLLDRTHVRFFGLRNVDELFSAAGLNVLDVQFVLRHPLETEFASTWAKLSGNAKRLILNSKSSYVYQVVVRAAPVERLQGTISIATVHIPVPSLGLKAAIKQLIPARLKQAVKRVIK
jgi:2-polyprenyl-3-methyl-5-hydroxy-6-metoxy-1,4-benzoquinol methylase